MEQRFTLFYSYVEVGVGVLLLLLLIYSTIRVLRRRSSISPLAWLKLAPSAVALLAVMGSLASQGCFLIESLLGSLLILLSGSAPKLPTKWRHGCMAINAAMTIGLAALGLGRFSLLWIIVSSPALAYAQSALRLGKPAELVRYHNISVHIEDMIFLGSLLVMASLSALGLMLEGVRTEWAAKTLYCLLAGISATAFVDFSLRNLDGRVFSLSRRHRSAIDEAAISIFGVDMLSPLNEASKSIYDRLVMMFEDEKLYLDPDLNLTYVARKLFTNKVYLSKTISLYSGKNFCTFVNNYRVRHALEVFRNDPYLRVGQLAQISGFRSVPAFNIAFRGCLDSSPSEWCRNYREKLKI